MRSLTTASGDLILGLRRGKWSYGLVLSGDLLGSHFVCRFRGGMGRTRNKELGPARAKTHSLSWLGPSCGLAAVGAHAGRAAPSAQHGQGPARRPKAQKLKLEPSQQQTTLCNHPPTALTQHGTHPSLAHSLQPVSRRLGEGVCLPSGPADQAANPGDPHPPGRAGRAQLVQNGHDQKQGG